MAKKSNTEEFIKKALLVPEHQNKNYSYDNFVYKGNYVKSFIICLKHGEFEQNAHDHLAGYGCPACGGVKRLTTGSFIQRSQEIHERKYSYDNFVYKNNSTKSWITCQIHGDFQQIPSDHLNGHGCPECGGVKKLTSETFIQRAQEVHGVEKYDYSKVEYKNIHSKVKIYCKSCEKYFEQNVKNHLNGHGCSFCIGLNKTTEDFIKEAQQVHGIEKYSYNNFVYKNNRFKSSITCLIHGDFMQTPHDHLKGSGCGSCKSSKGELKIFDILKQNKVDFIQEFKFENCKNINKLSFDFYLVDYNILIEYDGIQHFELTSFSTDKSIETMQKNLEEVKYRDAIKTEWARDNNIPLIRIPYWEYDNLEEKINKLIKCLRNNIL